MGKGTLEVSFRGDSAQLMGVVRAVHQEEQKVVEGTKKITEASKAADAAQRRWGREANKMLRDIESPMERHGKRVEALKGKLQANVIGQKQYSAAVLQSLKVARDEAEVAKKAADLRKANTPAAIAARQAEAAAAIAASKQEAAAALEARKKEQAADREAASEAQRLEAARRAIYERTRPGQLAYMQTMQTLKTLRAQGKITEAEYRREVDLSKQSLREAGKAQTAAFGPSALSQIKTIAAGYIGISTAIGAVRTAFSAMEQQRHDAAQRSLESRAGIGELAQLAETPEQMDRLMTAAKRTYGEGGAENLDEAGRFVFALESAGALESRKLFSDLKARSLVNDPAEMAKSAKTMIATMGQEETGGFRPLVSKAFGVSKFSPAKAEEILQGAARSGTSAEKLGISDEEVLAATALMSEAKGSADEGGTYLAQMMRTMKAKGGFEGQTLERSLSEIQQIEQGGQSAVEFFGGTKQGTERLQQIGFSEDDAKAFFKAAAADQAGMSPEDFKKWFGRAQGQESYEVLSRQLPRLREATAAAVEAERTDAVGRKLELHDSDVTLRTGLLKKQAEAKKFLGEEDMAAKHNAADSLQDENERIRKERGDWAISRYIRRWDESGHRWMYGDEEFVNDYANDWGAPASKEFRSSILKDVEAADSLKTLAFPEGIHRDAGNAVPVDPSDWQRWGGGGRGGAAVDEPGQLSLVTSRAEPMAQPAGADAFAKVVSDFGAVVRTMRDQQQQLATDHRQAVERDAEVATVSRQAAEELGGAGRRITDALPARPMLGSPNEDR